MKGRTKGIDTDFPVCIRAAFYHVTRHRESGFGWLAGFCLFFRIMSHNLQSRSGVFMGSEEREKLKGGLM
ncbi:hypothetical protein HBI40_039770 [Parastagonospora nodorum]|nr:hypothetical protein HBI76_064270 [Parastagonospora nodorum]KAH6266415.1 hypothetical protein HBI41_101840 [Parastagonospora nodorum]KAH6299882.1 hypothetical protein HBI40_039770 [Parastagonospora nodorum]